MTINDALGKKVHIGQVQLFPCTYVMIDGKVKLASKVKDNTFSFDLQDYYVDKAPYEYKGENYLVLKGENELFILKDSDSPLYLSFLHNDNLWDEYLNELRNNYTFLDITKGRTYHDSSSFIKYDKLSPIVWDGYKWDKGELIFSMCEIDSLDKTIKCFNLTPKLIESQKNDVFINNSHVPAYKKAHEIRIAKEKAIRDSFENCMTRLAVAKDYMLFEDSTKIYKGDTIAIYCYLDSCHKFLGLYHNVRLRLKDCDIIFVNEDIDRPFLKKKGQTDVLQRFQTALKYSISRYGRIEPLTDTSACISAQDKILRCDSSTGYDNNSVPIHKTMYIYDARGKQINNINYDWKDGTWLESSKYTYTFDSGGKELTETVYNWSSNVWVPSNKYESTYDSRGNKLSYSAYEWSDGDFIGLYKNIFTYDLNGKELSFIKYNYVSGTWAPFCKVLLSYDNLGQQTSKSSYYWKNGGWGNPCKDQYTYNEHGNVTSITMSWLSNNKWVVNASRKDEYIYDTQGNILDHIHYAWTDSNMGDHNIRNVYTYNGSWVNNIKDVFSYDAYGNKVKETRFVWDNNSWIMHYSYFYYYN